MHTIQELHELSAATDCHKQSSNKEQEFGSNIKIEKK